MSKYYNTETSKSRKDGLATPGASGSRTSALRTTAGSGSQELTVQDIQVKNWRYQSNKIEY